MKTYIWRTFPVILILFFIVSCTPNQSSDIDATGASFIKTTLSNSAATIKASGLAQAQSQNPRVRHLAEMLIADQNKIALKLKDIASEGAVDTTGTVDATASTNLSDLSKTSGTDFDKSYIPMIVKGQEKELIAYIAATQSKNNDLGAFARETLKIIHLHLDSARAIAQSLK